MVNNIKTDKNFKQALRIKNFNCSYHEIVELLQKSYFKETIFLN